MTVTISRFENVMLGGGKKLLDSQSFENHQSAFEFIKNHVDEFTAAHWQETLANPFTTFAWRELVNFGDAIHDAMVIYEITVA